MAILSVDQYAELHRVSSSRVRHWLKEGRIKGARKLTARAWLIPSRAARPRKLPAGRPVGSKSRTLVDKVIEQACNSPNLSKETA